MKLLSRQQVTVYGFELYFLAAVSEEEAAKMPDPNDLDSVGNREWLWQRDYTTLELQVRLYHFDKMKEFSREVQRCSIV